MKKQFLALILSALLLFLLASCENKNESKDGGASTDDDMTVADIVTLFDEDVYFAQTYDDQMIDAIRQKLVLEGEIVSVVHIMNQKTSAPNLEWVYVYEFTEETDAAAFEENRQAYAETIEGGVCFRHGNIVVYGNSPIIAELDA